MSLCWESVCGECLNFSGCISLGRDCGFLNFPICDFLFQCLEKPGAVHKDLGSSVTQWRLEEWWLDSVKALDLRDQKQPPTTQNPELQYLEAKVFIAYSGSSKTNYGCGFHLLGWPVESGWLLMSRRLLPPLIISVYQSGFSLRAVSFQIDIMYSRVITRYFLLVQLSRWQVGFLVLPTLPSSLTSLLPHLWSLSCFLEIFFSFTLQLCY